MGKFQSLEEAQAFFEGDRFAKENGMVLTELSDDGAVCEMDITSRHRNAYGGLMGGAIFTLADFAFAAASNHRHSPTVALQVSVNFLSAAKGTHLTARAHCRKDGKTTCVYAVDITDETGRDVAQFIGTGYKL